MYQWPEIHPKRDLRHTMQKLDLLPILGAFALLLTGAQAQSADFTLCKGAYALCTSAKCAPVPGKEGTVACACEVRTGYSAGQSNCAQPRDGGKEVQSRYYPVKSLSICANDRPWANCLGKPCTVDRKDPSKATCTCTTEKGKGPYVIVGTTYTPETCTTGIISSATFKDHKGITKFLRSTGKLEPFAIKVLNRTQSERRMQPTGGKPGE
jgi:hypothetical protein